MNLPQISRGDRMVIGAFWVSVLVCLIGLAVLLYTSMGEAR